MVLPKCLQKAKRSYQKDMTNFKEARDTNARALDVGEDGEESKYFFFFSHRCCNFRIKPFSTLSHKVDLSQSSVERLYLFTSAIRFMV